MIPPSPPTDPRPAVLLVDDDRDVLNAMSFALATDGWDVVGYSHAEAALAAPPRSLACLVVDQNLPGQSGLDLVDGLRARGVSAPALLITTHPSARTRLRALRKGVEILEKPLLGDDLGSAVRRLVACA